MKDKITILKTLKKKNLKTVQKCQDLCYNIPGATHFKWKGSKQAKKRTCFCEAIDYKNKKKFHSGPVMC